MILHEIQQTILMKYHALFVIFEKVANFDCRLLQIIGGALRVILFLLYSEWSKFSSFCHAERNRFYVA